MNSDVQRRRIYQAMANAESDERLRCIDLMGAVAMMIGREPENSPSRPIISEIVSAMQSLPTDPAASVQGWGRRALALVSDDHDAERLINRMADSDAWQQRLLSLATAQMRKVEMAGPLAKRQLDDPDATVQHYAQATQAAIRAATTRPSTAPSAAPATTPASQP